MDRVARLQNLNTSFSLASLAEGSEVISEADEILEVQSLCEKGENAFHRSAFDKALKFYHDALEIDGRNVESLCGRAAVFLETGKPHLAKHDIEKLLILEKDLPQVYFLLGRANHQLGDFRGAMLAFVKVIQLDPDSHHMDLLADNIGFIVAHLYHSLTKKQPDVNHDGKAGDAYSKLCEAGCMLFQMAEYDTCVKVLHAAQKIETNQQGITMKILLTLGNAHTQLNSKELAISLYQECLALAKSAHDTQYQMKTLVNIASLFMDLNEKQQAIIHYDRLISLQREIRSGDPDSPPPDFWNRDLECALHLNMSIAYKSLGDVEKSLHHANLYFDNIRGHEVRGKGEGHSHLNLGTLKEIMGEYQQALEHYKEYLKQSRKRGNKKDVAQAYGCLGSIYGHLSNSALASSFHDQHISLSLKLESAIMLTQALELAGDTQSVLLNYDVATDCYKKMLDSCSVKDHNNRVSALIKLGASYRSQGLPQYGLYYFEQALEMGECYDMISSMTICKFHIACILQDSTQMKELEKAQKYFSDLIPMLKKKIQNHHDEGTFIPSQLESQLQDSYYGMQNVLVKLGKHEECLLFAESQKSNSDIFKREKDVDTTGLKLGRKRLNGSDWNFEKISRVVSHQKATILYFTLLQSSINVWVLHPSEGLARFYSTKGSLSGERIQKTITDMICEIKKETRSQVISHCVENRALPIRQHSLLHLRKANNCLSLKTKHEKSMKQSDNESESAVKNENEPMKSPLRRLFDLILSPVDDILNKLEKYSELVIIPDNNLYDCPFHMLQNWSKIPLAERFRVSYISSLHMLERVHENEMNQLRRLDEEQFNRNESKNGGLTHIRLQGQYGGLQKTAKGEATKNKINDPEYIDSKKTSNPRLISIVRTSTTEEKHTPQELTRRQNTCQSGYLYAGNIPEVARPGGRATNLSHIPSNCKTPRALCDKSSNGILERAVGYHTMSTLVTCTATKTDVTTSDITVTDFQQVSSKEKAVVIGAPTLPSKLMLWGRDWQPRGSSVNCKAECVRVADYLEVDAITDEAASKHCFLQELSSASFLHIATIGCLKEAALVMSPLKNLEKDDEQHCIMEKAFLITAEEIAECNMKAKVVVLSSGWSSYDRKSIDIGFKLPGAFLAAGSQAVLANTWAIPDAALEIFYYHFYRALNSGEQHVMEAVSIATNALKKDDRWSFVGEGNPFMVIGKDVMVNIKEMKHAMMDQKIDRAEEQVVHKLHQDPLNPPAFTPSLSNKEVTLTTIQQYLSHILEKPSHALDIISKLIDLLDSSLKRLHYNSSITSQPSCLSAEVNGVDSAMKLLRLLGFHFQGQAESLSEPYVIYPHWNQDNLLTAAYEALYALAEIYSCGKEGENCIRCIRELLPTSQTIISHLVDVLCITKHSPDLQLKVTDASVRPLWRNLHAKAVLQNTGFQQITSLLHHSGLSLHRRIMNAVLQLFIHLSTNKSPSLLQKMDVNEIGGPDIRKSSTMSAENKHLPSLTPLLLPRNQLRMSTPWLSTIERADEMKEKQVLARVFSDLNLDARCHFVRAKTWHQQTLSGQGDKSLDEIGRPKSTPKKVKVVSGNSLSQRRHLVDEKPSPTLGDTEERRDYAHYIISQRLDKITLHQRDHLHKIYLPFVQNV